MARHAGWTFLACAAVAMAAAPADAAGLRSSLKAGSPEIRSAGPLAFGPEGILFVADPKSAAIFAIDTGDADESATKGGVNVEGIDQKVAAALGTSADQVAINDMAVNPASGMIYLSVSRGMGPGAQPALLRVNAAGKIEDVPLKDVPFSQVTLANAPADSGEGRRNQRAESITDLAFFAGRVIVAGLSNEEFASKLRAVQFPFAKADDGTSVEIYHGAHGGLETRSPVRTFIPFEIEGKPHLVAAYTCTPLVTFPVSVLEGKEESKVRGRTVAELGNRNRPLDMISYTRDGKSYILMANSARGMMRIPTAGIADAEGIEEKINDKAGLGYETIKELEGVTQLDKLNDSLAVVIMQKDGRTDLATIDTP